MKQLYVLKEGDILNLRDRKWSRVKCAYWLLINLLLLLAATKAEDPSVFYTWNVAYLKFAPLGVNQQVIGINGMFPGPTLDAVTNDNIHINVFNFLDEPLLFTWNGLEQRRTSWQDGTAGTNCPIPPGSNWTYEFQVKDQVGTFTYFPSILYQRAAGGYGAIRVKNRAPIAVPFAPPADDFILLIGDWYNQNHQSLRAKLDSGSWIGSPAGVLINGKRPFGTGAADDHTSFTVEAGKTYRLRVSNVGTLLSVNFRIEGHSLLLVETEGSYTSQMMLNSLDIHVGQSYSILVQASKKPADFYIVATTKFFRKELEGVAILHYTSSQAAASGPLPAGPHPQDVTFSIQQAQAIRWNLTTNAARPNPQGSYHYGSINITRRMLFRNTAAIINKQQRFAVNGRCYIAPDTPLKLADYYKISGVFTLGSIPDFPPASTSSPVAMITSVIDGGWRNFAEIVLENPESQLQSWHIDGHSFFVVGLGVGKWSDVYRQNYNLRDAVFRSTTQVYPRGWTAILVALDNVGMWNFRSQILHRQYLGQELYIRVYNPEESIRTEAPIPTNHLTCGRAHHQAIESLEPLINES